MNSSKAKKALGEWLRAYRNKIGLTAYRVAKDGNITIGQVKIVEDGETNYTVNILLGYIRGCGLQSVFERVFCEQIVDTEPPIIS